MDTRVTGPFSDASTTFSEKPPAENRTYLRSLHRTRRDAFIRSSRTSMVTGDLVHLHSPNSTGASGSSML